MAIQLIYKYHMINEMANKITNDMDVKRNMGEFIIILLFVESLYTDTKGRLS